MQTSDSSKFFQAESALAIEDARKQKAERTKSLGSPIDLPGKPLSLLIRGNELWTAESSAVVQRLDLETGQTLDVYKGHTGPVTSIDLIDDTDDASLPPLLVSGSWDKTIRVWDTRKKRLLSSTNAHSDFVKCLIAVPVLKLLISGGSDNIIRLWDLSNARSSTALPSLGFLSQHTRPISCLAVDTGSVMPTTFTLFSADSMGAVKVWDIELSSNVQGTQRSVSGVLSGDLGGHRTGVNDMYYGEGKLWTASIDETVVIRTYPVPPPSTDIRPSPLLTLPHRKPVKALLPLGPKLTELLYAASRRTSISSVADRTFLSDLAALADAAESLLLTAHGDVLRLYDLASGDERSPDVLGEIDVHWHDVTALRVWVRVLPSVPEGEGVQENAKGRKRAELWVVSGSLDGTVRKWKLDDFTNPPKREQAKPKAPGPPAADRAPAGVQMTEEEERELAELMGSDSE